MNIRVFRKLELNPYYIKSSAKTVYIIPNELKITFMRPHN